MGVKRLTIPALIEYVEEACEFVAELAHRAGMEEDAVYHCRLAVEEICANIIEHGYQFHGSDQVIDIECSLNENGLQIQISDDSAQFDPLKSAQPDPNQPLWERGTGGWGIFFVRKYMDRLDYRYRNHRNQLIMEKHFSTAAKR